MRRFQREMRLMYGLNSASHIYYENLGLYLRLFNRETVFHNRDSNTKKSIYFLKMVYFFKVGRRNF